MPYYDNPYYNQYGMPSQQIDARMMQLQQQRNALQNPMQFQPNAQLMLKGRMVSSFDEAKAAMIDLDGSVFVFPDIANNRIYTKQIGMNGSAIFNVYSLTNPNDELKPEENAPVVKKVFDKEVQSLNSRLAELESIIGGIKDVSAGQNDANGKHVQRTKSATSSESASKSVSE